MKFLAFTKRIIQNYSFMGVIHRTLGDKGYILLLSIAVGVISGSAAVLLKFFAHSCHDLAVMLGSRLPWMMWILPLVPAVGIFGCIVIVRLFFNRGPYEKSLAGVITATTNGTSDLPRSKTYSHIITSGLAVGMGASAGLEAPIALTGSAIGSNVAKVLQLGRESRTLLLACGGGAGISAIFNSPVAGALFACEILLPSFSVPALVPLLMASAAAAVVSELFYSQDTFIQLSEGTAWTVSNIPYYVLIGLAAGLVSSFIIRTSIVTAKQAEKYRNVWVRGALGCLILYVFFLLFPALKGEGYGYVSSLLAGNESAIAAGSPITSWFSGPNALVVLLGLLVVIKPFVSAVSIESGGDGGIFGPSMFIGAFLGYFFAKILNHTGVTVIDPVNCVAVGMGGVLAGVMHAPLTGMFLIAELTGGYKLFVPLMIVVALSSFISKRIARHNVYKSMIAMKGGTPEQKDDAVILMGTQLRDLVENDYVPVKQTDTLRTLLKALMKSRRNIFPVLSDEGAIVGIVRVENIRPFLLDTELYDMVLVFDMMSATGPVLEATDSLHDATQLFENLHVWNLPVVENGKYLGFVSKAGVFDSYRKMLRSKQELF